MATRLASTELVASRYGSDVVVEVLRDAGIRHVALNPGATFRALHDSLGEADDLETIVVLHEEIAVAIAHGYAKSAGRPMAVFLHDQVGLQHAAMALFNAWVDGVPMLVVGGSGPRDTARRRPWIDWIHSGQPESQSVRDIIKWDDEPASVEALPLSLARALRIATTPPMGPVYVAVDILLQEADASHVELPSLRLDDPVAVTAPRTVLADLADALVAAERPVLLIDRGTPACRAPLVELAEQSGAAVVDLGGRSFPADHPADRSTAAAEVLAEADLVLAVELRDVTWGLTSTDLRDRSTRELVSPQARVVAIGLGELRHRGSIQLESLAPEVQRVTAEPATLLGELAGELARRSSGGARVVARRAQLGDAHAAERRASRERAAAQAQERPIAPAHLAAVLGDVLGNDGWQLANGLLGGWPRRLWPMSEEGSYLGRSGGEGLGYGLPASVGAALAQREQDVLVVDVQADGDLMYTPQALWTAAHHQLPLLIVVHNNRTYGRDETHQLEIARARGRDVDVPPRGIRLEEPNIDFAALARAQGVEGIGPIDDPLALRDVLEQAASTVRTERRPVLVDVICSRDLAR
jgi:thiamine pyrophosphate-dependent acetolactate synthase large subunit-like protein